MTTALRPRRPRAPAERRRTAPGVRRLRLVAPPTPPTRPHGSRIARALRWILPVTPLLFVNAFAVLGQVLYGFEAYSPPGWEWQYRLVVAIGAAVSVESIGNVVQWHAHDALLRRATSTAARLRRVSYVIAFGVGALNYSHFAGPGMGGWEPNATALMFGAFSASTPWLWGMHTRRVHQIQLLREGHADSTGATFSAERWRWFPWRTLGALRYSIEHSIPNPAQAWVLYNRARLARRTAKLARRASGDEPMQQRNSATPSSDPVPPPPPPAAASPSPKGPVALAVDETTDEQFAETPKPRETQPRPRRRTEGPGRPGSDITDDEARAKAREWIAAHDGRLPRTRVERRAATSCGGDRADRLIAEVAAELSTEPTEEAS